MIIKMNKVEHKIVRVIEKPTPDDSVIPERIVTGKQ